MKSFTILCVIAALIAVVSCQQPMGSEKTEPKMRQMKDQQTQGTQETMLGSAYSAPSRGSPAAAYQQPSYAAPAVPAPICQNAYMFSCSPNLAPVPCVRPASYGSAGAYSQFVPQYAFPAEY